MERRGSYKSLVEVTGTVIVGIQGLASATVTDMSIIANLLKKQTGLEIRAIPEDDTLRKLEWFKQGYIDMLYESATIPIYNEGKAPDEITIYRGPFQTRFVGSAHSGAFGFMVGGDSHIKTIYDITPETRLALFRSNILVYGLLAWLELYKSPMSEDHTRTEWNAKLLPFDSFEASLRSIAEGKADVAMATPENPCVKELATAPHGIRFLDLPATIDPEGARRFWQLVPFGNLAPAPRHGVKEIWGVTSFVGTACLWCRPDLDIDLAYELTKWFDTNYELYKDEGNKLVTYTREAVRQTLDVAMAPVHDGTIKYFREIGLWTAADDARQEYNSKLMDWYCQAWDEAVAEASRREIPVSSASEKWIRLWDDYKKELRIPHYRQMTDDEIREGLVLMKHLGR